MDTLGQMTSLELYLCEHANQKKIPISGCFELLPLCNMNCAMCYVRLGRKEMEKQGGMRTAEEWLELAAEMKQSGVLFVLLTGGEPFIFPDFRKLYTGLLELGMILTINTNGTLIDEEMAAFLGKNRPRRVNVTLYGADDAAYEKLCHYPGGFKKTIEGIKLLKKYGVDVKLNGSLTKENEEDWEKLLVIAKDLDVPIKIYTYMYPATRERNLPYAHQVRLSPEVAAECWVNISKKESGEAEFFRVAKENLELVTKTVPGEESPEKMKCRAGKSSFIVNWQGKMMPCIMMNQPSVPVFEVGFARAWEQTVKHVENITLSPKCSACTLREVCSVCAASTFLENGNFETPPEYVCRFTKHILECQKKALL